MVFWTFFSCFAESSWGLAWQSEARFTALRFQDAQFLAATEKDETQSIRDRAKQWTVVMGLEELNPTLVGLRKACFASKSPPEQGEERGFQAVS